VEARRKRNAWVEAARDGSCSDPVPVASASSPLSGGASTAHVEKSKNRQDSAQDLLVDRCCLPLTQPSTSVRSSHALCLACRAAPPGAPCTFLSAENPMTAHMACLLRARLI